MINVVLVAVLGSLEFIPYEWNGKFFLQVKDYKCPSEDETLSPQYNLGSVLIPGMSPEEDVL